MNKIKIVLLPCEIYHREFDAKLLLSCKLAGRGNYGVLIGYDKFFNIATQLIEEAVILDKSCSTLIWDGRLKRVIKRGGAALINDEEGFNGLHKDAAATWFNRVDKTAASNIGKYLCWGDYDYDFYSPIKELDDKKVVIGNCRHDLLGTRGKGLYANEIYAIKGLYGKYVLCVDNFVVEHRNKVYGPPRFRCTTDEEYRKQVEEFKRRAQDTKKRREQYAELLEFAVKKMPYKQFVFRPHPISDYRWWNERFWRHRNFHICTIKNVEPWLNSCESMISMGCTTGIQASISMKPVIEIVDRDKHESMRSLRGMLSKFAKYKAETKEELVEQIELSTKKDNKGETMEILNELAKYWYSSEEELTVDRFYKEIEKHGLEVSKNELMDKINLLSQYIEKMNRSKVINQDKWSFERLEEIQRRVNSFTQTIFSDDINIRIYKVSDGLFYLERAK